MNDNIRQEQSGGGCLSAVFILVLLLFVMGAVLGAPHTPSPLPPPTAVAQQPLHPAPTATDTAVPTHTATTPHTATPTETATATNTPTATHTPTQTSTPEPATHTPTPLPPPPTFTPPPLPTPQEGYSRTVRAPILMYHYISTPPEDADKYRLSLSVEPAAFRQQMAYLSENGYTTIDLYRLSQAITGNQPLPPKPVILTFDDGYVDNYEIAFPILQEFGLTGTFFVVTEFIDNGRSGYLTWDMVRQMAAAGHRFEPHSRTHPDLRDQERDVLIWEILGPLETLTYHLGYTPRYFSYPSGFYDEEVVQILRELHFWGAVTTRSGKEHGFPDRYEWPRLRVRNDTPLPEFVDLVAPAGANAAQSPP